MTRTRCTTHTLLALAVLTAGPAMAQTTPAGRLLASNCFQCHGINGRGPGFERLAGKSAAEIEGELQEMRRSGKTTDLMTKHAMGYTDAQIQALSVYLANPQ